MRLPRAAVVQKILLIQSTSWASYCLSVTLGAKGFSVRSAETACTSITSLHVHLKYYLNASWGYIFLAKYCLDHTFHSYQHFSFSHGNLHHLCSQEPMDEGCYEQMKARPQRSASNVHEATASAQVKVPAQVASAPVQSTWTCF